MITSRRLALLPLLAALALPAAARIAAQAPASDPCVEGRGRDDSGSSHCEVRTERLAAGPLAVDAGRNGGIRVTAWDEGDTLVQAIVRARADTDDRAKAIVDGVRIETAGGTVRAVGPETGRHESWSVSYQINTPRRTDLTLNARNGGITIDGVSGNINFETTNGGVRLTDLSGWVRGQTRNGGLTVALAGDRWDGTGLDVETRNGGVSLSIPDGYSAELETRTVNGGFRTEIPLTVQGDLTTRHGISATLGSGGAHLRVRTTNGGVRIAKRAGF
jgi:hypothetical protein